MSVVREMSALYRGPWGRLGGLITANADGSDRQRVRSAVARSVFSRGGKMIHYSPAASIFGDGDERVEPSHELLAFAAHQYAVPEGYLTGADDNELRDVALHRALNAKHLHGTPVPDSFTVTTRCPTLGGELGEAGYAATALRTAERRSLLTAIPYALVGVAFPGLLTWAIFANGNDGQHWFLGLFFLALTVASVSAVARRVIAAVRFFRLPPATAELWSDLLLKEAIATYFHDLYTEGYLPRAWFHDTFCRNRPITRRAYERLGTETLTRSIITFEALNGFPKLRRARRRRDGDGQPAN
ncbi:hypothetical protein [Rathayibacter sp. AY1H2]|uniref:hypothetical protein n=1 Tax=Rathayibacter sp. AY1H2 TaxID=2080566 RepID=UPI000CE87F4A|nr:hypothetical protein [Rathayibacter sp. AY1H2]PPG81598.1 hypothetical protein C5C29_15655 [Rathayibacter sp. AY1H2]